MKIPWRRKWQPTPASLPGESHGQRSLMGYSPQRLKKSDTAEQVRTHSTPTGRFNQGSDSAATLRVSLSSWFPSALIFLALTPSVDSPLLWRNGHHSSRAHIPQVPVEQKRISVRAFTFCSSILAHTPLPLVQLGQGSGEARSSNWLNLGPCSAHPYTQTKMWGRLTLPTKRGAVAIK